jgi:hypothetical protein
MAEQSETKSAKRNIHCLRVSKLRFLFFLFSANPFYVTYLILSLFLVIIHSVGVLKDNVVNLRNHLEDKVPLVDIQLKPPGQPLVFGCEAKVISPLVFK